MNQTTTLLSANALLIVIFLCTAIAIYRQLTANSVLLWMMAALFIGAIEIALTVIESEPSAVYFSVTSFLNVICGLCIVKMARVYADRAPRGQSQLSRHYSL